MEGETASPAAQGPVGGTGQAQQGKGAVGLGHSLAWPPHSSHSPEAWSQPSPCTLWPESTPPKPAGLQGVEKLRRTCVLALGHGPLLETALCLRTTKPLPRVTGGVG